MTYYPANKKYERDTLLKVSVAFNRNTEPELVKRMEEQENRAGYLKELVRQDVEKGGEH